MKQFFVSKYFKLGVTVVLAGGILILFYIGTSNFQGVGELLSTIGKVLSPFIYGFVMAYLISPVYNGVVRNAYKPINKVFSNKKRALIISRILATIISLAVIIGIVGGLLYMVIPELIKSITNLANTLPYKLDRIVDWVNSSTDRFSHGGPKYFDSVLPKIRDSITDWIKYDLMNMVGNYVGRISQGLLGTLYTILNMLIGLVVCVYMLNGKERFKAQSRKIIIGSFNQKRSSEIFDFSNYVNRTFGGFINGKIIDSMIIGALCFVIMSIIGFPYTMLVSVIIGVTNIIPFFGPFIGAIPSTFLIFIVDPIQALYFMVMIFGLQQFDGNILGPKILGETTGLGSFWVMFAIIVGGGFFGFIGMILGVPVCAVCGYYLNKHIDKRLELKSMPTDIVEYEDFNCFDINRRDFE